MNYISLFSSAGIGCFGFKKEGFDCIATNELIERRLEIQKFNQKCKYESGYICGDITQESTKQQLMNEITLWQKKEKIKSVDVVIATPPCQGMSVANHKKSETEIVRNSLVIESIKIINQIKPKFFIFENVPAFMKTLCTDIDGNDKPISEAIENNLGSSYSYYSKVINFKNYGACSSRQRTLVIGVLNEYADEISPYELFPKLQKEKTLREVIGQLPTLTNMGEVCPTDIYHSFRPYPEYMRCWISDLAEGQSAFDNADDNKKPHQIIDGQLVLNVRKNGDKYTRCYWDKVGPCVHTRNDQLASQNTIHPHDDRVFSVRELMLMMTVPPDFKWTSDSENDLNNMSLPKKQLFLKQNETKIRQSLGEAVPTVIFQSIAKNIKETLSFNKISAKEISNLINSYKLDNTDSLLNFVSNNPEQLSISDLSKIAELANTNRTDSAAFYTNKSLITEMIKMLPDITAESISILEPSVGVGNFIPMIVKKYEGKRINFDLVDIDPNSIKVAKQLLEKFDFPDSVKLNFINDDFLTHTFKNKYDLVIGNPPFYKINAENKNYRQYIKNAINKKSNNLCSYFLDKSTQIANYVALILPKFILNTPEFLPTREYLSQEKVDSIIDFGEKGFPGVLIETIALFLNPMKPGSVTHVKSISKRLELLQKQSYIFDKNLPYWIIYRNDEFDAVLNKLEFGIFDVFRDRQLTNTLLSSNASGIRVLKSRNLSDDGTEIIDIPGYDSYIEKEKLNGLTVNNYIDSDNLYLTPNMTYYPRVMKKPKGVVVNGSVAILIPKYNFELTDSQLVYYSSKEYRDFYQIARNYQTRSLNVDSCSVYFFGKIK